MKLLFDQNISFRLVKRILHIFPQACQVRHIGLENTSDQDIWTYAKENGFCIVTFDADFLDIAQIQGIPPKIIWLRTGNITTTAIVKLLAQHQEVIKDFIETKEYEDRICLEVID